MILLLHLLLPLSCCDCMCVCSVQEMCAVTSYMCSSTKREVVSYLEEAISVYNLSCK